MQFQLYLIIKVSVWQEFHRNTFNLSKQTLTKKVIEELFQNLQFQHLLLINFFNMGTTILLSITLHNDLLKDIAKYR